MVFYSVVINICVLLNSEIYVTFAKNKAYLMLSSSVDYQ